MLQQRSLKLLGHSRMARISGKHERGQTLRERSGEDRRAVVTRREADVFGRRAHRWTSRRPTPLF
eukprot:scaffold5880_cov32-Tisochrysis_lutea.AAC.4